RRRHLAARRGAARRGQAPAGGVPGTAPPACPRRAAAAQAPAADRLLPGHRRGGAVLLAGAVFTAWALAPAGGRIGVGQAGRSAACPPQPLPAAAWPVRRSRTMRAA